MLNNLYNNEPIKFKKLVKPIFECAANYNFFTDASIVSYRLQKLPENLQYDSRTSWLAKKLGDSSFAKFFFENGISPQKIDHFIFGYTSNMGKGFMKGVDVAAGDKEFSPALYKRLKETQKTMSKLSKKERAVLENPNIGSNEKNSRQEAIQKQRIALVEKFFR